MSDFFKDRREMVNSFRPNRGKKVAQKRVEIPDGIYRKCSNCESSLLTEDIISHNFVCPKCEYHFRMTAKERISITVDSGTFREILAAKRSKNPLEMPNYSKKAEVARQTTKINEAVITGIGKIMGFSYAIAVMDSYFLMGSMGAVVGEKITQLTEVAIKRKLPLLIFAASGGARMQEGAISLMQMVKTSAAIGRHSEAGLLYISVPTNPTTGGVTASFAMLGDVIISEPNALIGFAGQRVIEQTIGEKLPDGFQRSEFLLKQGFLDMIVSRHDMKATIAKISRLHGLEVNNA